ncbi:MAG: hypothetical protein U0835_23820 [Isosphaeraceae bacterium]
MKILSVTAAVGVAVVLGGLAVRAAADVPSPNEPNRERRDEPSPKQGRSVFVYTAGEFHRVKGRVWVDRRHEGPDSNFIETARTPEFVEMYDRDRDLLIRLLHDHGEWLCREQQQWVPWPGSEGRWK